MTELITPGVPGRYWHPLDDGRIQCDVCPRFCKLHEGQRGLCFVRARHDNPQADLASVLTAVCLQTLGRRLPYSNADLDRILSPQYFVSVRTTPGGPAPAETARALAASQETLDRLRETYLELEGDLEA